MTATTMEMKVETKKNLMAQILSPFTSSGSMILSTVIHGAVVGTLVAVLAPRMQSMPAPEEILDLGYETFSEPPPPTPEIQKVRRVVETVPTTPVKQTADSTPQELQDDKAEVAGTQQAAPQTSQVASDGTGQAVSTPYYRIKPKYPREALIEGLEGWVSLMIDITEQGSVENVRVVDGEKKAVFQGEARRAVSQWKYKPFTDQAGQPIRKVDSLVRVDFKLTDNATAGL
ncbi:MAG: TonB family protein [Bdellovibrionales bacterium]|nr:TonB family protein [Bdellovibrionales bacterium]